MKQVIYLWNYTEWGDAQIYFLSIIKNALENASELHLSAASLKLSAGERLRNDLANGGREYVLENLDERIGGRIVLENYEKCLAN